MAMNGCDGCGEVCDGANAYICEDCGAVLCKKCGSGGVCPRCYGRLYRLC